jgi:hypothetical protein
MEAQMRTFLGTLAFVGVLSFGLVACDRVGASVSATAKASNADAAAQHVKANPKATRSPEEVKKLVGDLASRADLSQVQADTVIRDTKADGLKRHQQENMALKLSDADVDASAAPWEMFASQLDKQIRGNADWAGVQIVASPTDASWNDPRYGKYRAWRLIGDSLPAWGPSYRATQAQVSSGYKIFIDNLNITPPDPSLARQADDARKDYNKKLDALQAAQEKVGDHWTAFDARQRALPPNRQLTFDQWYKQFDGARVAGLQGDVDLAGQTYASVMNRAGGGYGFVASILNDFNNPAFQAPVESPSGGTVFARQYDISPDLQSFIDTSKSIPAGAAPKLSFSLNKSTGRQSIAQTEWSGGASYGVGFFSFGAHASGGSLNVDTSNSNFSMAFSAKNVSTFTVLPAGWLNGTAVKALQNGPWLPGGPVANGTIKLYGPDGAFDLIVNQVIVAYHPKVTASLSAGDYSYARSHFEASGGMSIGPFGFGGSYSRSNTDVKWDDVAKSFTAEDSTDVPQIIAVICSVMPNMH